MLRACLNAIPTNGNLQKRILNVDGICFRCEAELEFIAHALWQCPKMCDVWVNSPMHSSWAECRHMELNDAACTSLQQVRWKTSVFFLC